MTDRPNPPPDKLREWAAAERVAVQAEELVRAAVKAHLETGGPAPSAEMQRHAAELRARADALFHAFYKEVRDSGVSGA